MLRTIDVCDKNVFPEPPSIIVLANNTSTILLPDVTTSGAEFAYRMIFNSGANNLYYCFGETCDNTKNFNAFLTPGQQLNCPGCTQVCGYSSGGTSVATTVFKRKGL